MSSSKKTIFLKELASPLIEVLEDIYPKNEAFQIAFMFLEYHLSISKTQLLTNKEIEIEEDFDNILVEGIQKLKEGTPIQYVLGEVEFYNIKLMLSKDTLVPRPETEELVDLILKEYLDTPDLEIWDIGTGSGCIAISLAKNCLNASVLAMDISENALATVNKNCYLNRVKVDLLNQDLLDTKLTLPEGPFDLIISNPPYVLEREKELMQANVLEHEPHRALFVPDEDPLLFYRHIAERCTNLLKPSGKIFLEINENFGQETVDLFLQKGFKNTVCKKDLNNKDRIVVVQK